MAVAARQFDVVICGAGLVGLMLANLLRDSGFRIALIDATAAAQPLPEIKAPGEIAEASFESGYAPRVSALNAFSLELLEQCGVKQELQRFAEFSEMQIRDNEGTGEICFAATDAGQDHLGLVVENQAVIEALTAKLQRYDSVELLYEHELDDLESEDGASELFFTNADPISCQLLIAADGGNSTIRELCGLKTAGWNYDQTAVVTTICCEEGHGRIPRQWFTEEGPLAFLPLADEKVCSIVWSYEDAEALLALNAEQFCQRLERASEGELGRVCATDKRFSFPLRQHHAIRYTQPGIALIGDAAHTIHPLAGQGANLGLADAASLAREIRQALFADTGLSDPELLQRFARERQPHNLLIAAAMEGIKQAYGNQNPILKFARNKMMNLTNGNAVLKSLLVKVASGSL